MLTTFVQNRRRSLGVKWFAAVLGAVLLIAGCGSDDTAADEATTATTSTSTSTSPSTSTSITIASSAPTGSSAPTTGPTTIPGQPWDGFTSSGDVLAVIGVAYDDVLNVRAGPGTDQDIVATVEPLADDLVATGRARELPRSMWYEVTWGSETGWVNIGFVGFMGGTDDATAEFLDRRPPTEAETMVELGEAIAKEFASEDPPSRIVRSAAPIVGDLGEVMYDVIGIGDDALAGLRLHIFATPDEFGEGFGLRTIERTWFCSRGVSGELCV